MLSDSATKSSSTNDAIERAVQGLNTVGAGLSGVSLDQTTVARIVSSVDERLSRIDYDVAVVKAATNQLLSFLDGTEHRLYHLLKPTIETATSDCLVRHFQQDKTASDYREQRGSNMDKSKVNLEYHKSRESDQSQLSEQVNTSFRAAGLDMWPSGQFSSNDGLEAHQPSFFGYVSIQSIRAVFYKLKESLDILPTTFEQHYLVTTTVILVPANYLFSKGAFSSLVQFAHDLQYPKLDLEIVPIIEGRGACPIFCTQRAGDRNTLWELFDSRKDWVTDHHDLRTPLMLTVRPSLSHVVFKQKEKLDWHLMWLLPQGMITSGTDMFSPQHHVWNSLCPQ